MNRLLIFPVLLLTLLVGTPAFSAEKTSLEYAKMGRQLYSVIQCSFYAEEFKDKTEAERLTKLGIKIGREFLTAADSGKINKKDWSSNVPIYFKLIRGGPSLDFLLGRWWEWVTGGEFNKLHKNCKECLQNDKLSKMKMSNLYRNKNCDLIH